MAPTYDDSTGLYRDSATGAVVGYNPDFQQGGIPSEGASLGPAADGYVSASLWVASVSPFTADPNMPPLPNGQTFNGVLVGDLRANGSQAVDPAGQRQTLDLSGFADTDRVLVNWKPRDLPT